MLFRHHLLNGFPPPLGGGGFTGPVLVPLYRPIPLGPLYGLTPLRDWSNFWEYPNVLGFGLKALLIIPRVGLTAPGGLEKCAAISCGVALSPNLTPLTTEPPGAWGINGTWFERFLPRKKRGRSLDDAKACLYPIPGKAPNNIAVPTGPAKPG